MKPFPNLQGRHLILFFPMLFILFFCASCPRKDTTAKTLDSSSCKFVAGFADLGPSKVDKFREQIKAFNQKYSIYKSGAVAMGPDPVDVNPFLHRPHKLPNHLELEPNATIRRLEGANDNIGLMLGFGKPHAEKNEIALYIALIQETLTRINDDTCKVDFAQVMDSDNPVYFKYNSETGTWISADKNEIDTWVANLFGTDPAIGPVYKGYYIHHAYGNVDGFYDYLYLGLASGTQQDIIHIFSMHQPLKEILFHDGAGQVSRDIHILDTAFHSTARIMETSLVFRSAIDEIPISHTTVRPCPPYCPR